MVDPLERGGNSSGIRASNPIERGVLALGSMTIPDMDIRARTLLGGVTFEYAQTSSMVLQLIHDTVESRQRAISYRKFMVGAGVWAFDGPRYGREVGFNLKFDQTDTVNIHAEDLARQKVANDGFRAISVFCIVGPVQEDHASGRTTPTLHPCGRCRNRLARSPLVVDDTLFVMARPDLKVFQVGSLADIKRAHRARPIDSLATFTYKRRPAIFEPRPKTPANGYAFTVEEIEAVDATEYDETLGLYLNQRYFERAARRKAEKKEPAARV